VYETVEDERIRVEVKVSNNDKHFFASLLCDSGAQSELTLPARNIIQLGLTILKEGRVKSSTNQSKANLYFEPAVKVQIYFRRDNEVIEEKVALCTVSCLKDEYDAADSLVDQQLSEDEFLFSGRLEIDAINDKYHLNIPHGEYETLSGYILSTHESIPTENENLNIDNYDITIIAVSETKIETVKLKVIK
jgi:hypothetical protein